MSRQLARCLGVARSGRGWLDAAFDHDFEGALECELDFARCFLTGRSVSHDAGPFNDLGDEAFVAFFHRIPNPDFVIAGIGIKRRQVYAPWR